MFVAIKIFTFISLIFLTWWGWSHNWPVWSHLFSFWAGVVICDTEEEFQKRKEELKNKHLFHRR